MAPSMKVTPCYPRFGLVGVISVSTLTAANTQQVNVVSHYTLKKQPERSVKWQTPQDTWSRMKRHPLFTTAWTPSSLLSGKSWRGSGPCLIHSPVRLPLILLEAPHIIRLPPSRSRRDEEGRSRIDDASGKQP
ncbi:Hypothetical predicted protein [Pelobates cultripes]|uniref:Uncharacterized protein n=1 Tax=Pelobates cultripes TaxID=61616 RepID=A0AAD1S8L1_PELCU|nr:Hypothetical predicted protein [Pelobates cultripes]